MDISTFYCSKPTRSEKTIEDLMVSCLVEVNFLKDKEIQNILSLFHVQTFKKGTLLLNEGEIPRATYHNFGGCIRQFHLKNGEEKTTAFYTENQSVDAITGFSSNTPAPYYLECTEDTTVAILHRKGRSELFKCFPQFESLYRVDIEQKFHNYQQRFTHFMTSTPEERYLNLLDTRPDLLYRVPQYQLASYLGIKPESLSRIRKRIASK